MNTNGINFKAVFAENFKTGKSGFLLSTDLIKKKIIIDKKSIMIDNFIMLLLKEEKVVYLFLALIFTAISAKIYFVDKCGVGACYLKSDFNCLARKIERETKIDVNKADIFEIKKIPGIGVSYARRIIEYREKNGLFASLEDLLNVKGIGPERLKKMKKYIKI